VLSAGADVGLKDRVVLVAGGTGGLGRAVSLAFLEAGARVHPTYRRSEELEALRAAAGSGADRLEGHAVDATDEDAAERLVSDLDSRHGGLDALVNTVGGWAGGTKAWDAGSGELDRMLALNLRSGWVLCRAAARTMVPRGRGAIVNVASKAGVEATPGAAAYAASKAAAIAMIESLAADLRGTGVRANSVLPSVIDTEANRKAMPKADFSKWPKPEEIARVILFLCGDGAALVHGASVPVYGNR
jgi:NAD(P)-dependent dehydrogenase (short-subunit alcohol dehydrogenase family)